MIQQTVTPQHMAAALIAHYGSTRLAHERMPSIKHSTIYRIAIGESTRIQKRTVRALERAYKRIAP